jgi:hypothetical protein
MGTGQNSPGIKIIPDYTPVEGGGKFYHSLDFCLSCSWTRDVDAVFRPTAEIRAVAANIAAKLGLPEDWLNDGVKGFLSDREELSEEPVTELAGLSNLRIIWPSAEYLLAMKCMAARIDNASQDRADVEFLIMKLGFRREDQVLECVERFYPADRIHIKTVYFVREVLAGLAEKPDFGGEVNL